MGSADRAAPRSRSLRTATSWSPTERTANDEGAAGPDGDEGVIVTFKRSASGLLHGKTITDATGEGPFGFTFDKDGDLYTTEQFDGPLGPGEGAVASYQVNGDASLEPASPSVKNGGTDTCWFVITDDGGYGFPTSFFGGGRISSYRVGPGGELSLLEADAGEGAGLGASDLNLSRNSRHLYQLNSFDGTINALRVQADGGLQLFQTVQAAKPNEMAARIGLAGF